MCWSANAARLRCRYSTAHKRRYRHSEDAALLLLVHRFGLVLTAYIAYTTSTNSTLAGCMCKRDIPGDSERPAQSPERCSRLKPWSVLMPEVSGWARGLPRGDRPAVYGWSARRLLLDSDSCSLLLYLLHDGGEGCGARCEVRQGMICVAGCGLHNHHFCRCLAQCWWPLNAVVAEPAMGATT